MTGYIIVLIYSGAMEDLNKSIELSDGLGKTACQAYTQRALLYKLDGQYPYILCPYKKTI